MTYSSLSKPFLFDSQLKYRLKLAKKRLENYPVDSMNFLMMDLERPKLRTRHAHWCTYDLTGRTLFFYALAEGIDGEHITRLPELYERIMNNRRKSGTFGNSFEYMEAEPETAALLGSHFLSGLVNYYALTGDMRALNAAQEGAQFMLNKWDTCINKIKDPSSPNHVECWIVEAFAELYRETREEKYMNAIRQITYECVGQMDKAHSHGYMTTLRGILKASIYAEDNDLAEFVKIRRQEILDAGCITPNGDVSEIFPVSFRNEGCSIADWIMLNLYYAYRFDDSQAYAIAEHSLWNALYFNQFVTGGFGHRYLSDHGYHTYIEEAWWCCTPNAGMCLTEVARHAVTMKNGVLKLNFYLPGRYTIPSPEGEITVTVTTRYPISPQTIVKVSGTDKDIEIRVPECVKGYTCRRIDTGLGYELHLDGKIGHTIEKQNRGTIVKYGPLVIAPMIYMWDTYDNSTEGTTVPTGYAHDNQLSTDIILAAGEPDADGFYHFRHDPLPEWSVFEEGEMAAISGGEVASAYVPVLLPNGENIDMFMQPLCGATTNLTLMDILVDFKIDRD